jgi:hypothetical protein
MEDQKPYFMPDAGTDTSKDRRSRMEIESLDLGAEVRAVGLELIDPETREPIGGDEAGRAWASTLRALVGSEAWTLDFFAHLDRVREFCRLRSIPFREPNAHVVVIAAPPSELLEETFERFAGETFGVRAGALVADDPTVEGELANRGVDAYHKAFPNYLFCAVCDFENGFLTVLSERLWASEVIRRTRAAVSDLRVDVVRPA